MLKSTWFQVARPSLQPISSIASSLRLGAGQSRELRRGQRDARFAAPRLDAAAGRGGIGDVGPELVPGPDAGLEPVGDLLAELGVAEDHLVQQRASLLAMVDVDRADMDVPEPPVDAAL